MHTRQTAARRTVHVAIEASASCKLPGPLPSIRTGHHVLPSPSPFNYPFGSGCTEWTFHRETPSEEALSEPGSWLLQNLRGQRHIGKDETTPPRLLQPPSVTHTSSATVGSRLSTWQRLFMNSKDGLVISRATPGLRGNASGPLPLYFMIAGTVSRTCDGWEKGSAGARFSGSARTHSGEKPSSRKIVGETWPMGG